MSNVKGQSKIYQNYRVSVYEIKDILNLKEGDRIIFYEDRGKIYIKKME